MSKPPAAVRPWPPSAPGRRQPQPPAWQAILVVCLVDRQPARFVWKSLIGLIKILNFSSAPISSRLQKPLNQDFEGLFRVIGLIKILNFSSAPISSRRQKPLNQDFEGLFPVIGLIKILNFSSAPISTCLQQPLNQDFHFFQCSLSTRLQKPLDQDFESTSFRIRFSSTLVLRT